MVRSVTWVLIKGWILQKHQGFSNWSLDLEWDKNHKLHNLIAIKYLKDGKLQFRSSFSHLLSCLYSQNRFTDQQLEITFPSSTFKPSFTTLKKTKECLMTKVYSISSSSFNFYVKIVSQTPTNDEKLQKHQVILNNEEGAILIRSLRLVHMLPTVR